MVRRAPTPRRAAEGEGDGEPLPRSHAARPSAQPFLVLAVGLAVTGLLAFTCWTVNDRNETRLLRIQVREAGTVVAAAIPSIEAPLASAVDIADATGGDPAKFAAYMDRQVGPGRIYASVSLFALEPSPHPVARLGEPPFVAAGSPRFARALAEAERTGG
ncbi:MAG TPA: hypothetical protein VKW77_11005, partial [Acidimicrobiales bacterium]|nr:hypothetical protein [Acidimicrobiales bacterium]